MEYLTQTSELSNISCKETFEHVKLSQNQVNLLTSGKKHWSLKVDYLIKQIKCFGHVVTAEQLGYFIEVVVPREAARIRKQFFLDSTSGKRKNNLTPTDVKGTFSPVVHPLIGSKYHISWAFSGAVFRLIRIDGDMCYLDNPKYKREVLLACKTTDLRGLH